MADLNKKYQTILMELAQKIQNPEELEFVKGKMNELIMEYMSSIDKILEIEKNQVKLENKVQKIERELSMIEEDIYVNDEFEDDDCCDKMHDNDCEFEITCPYCGYEFLTDESYKSETEIKCPQCHEMIELDWKEEKCGGDCQSCGSQCYTTSSEDTTSNDTIKVEENSQNNAQNNNQQNGTDNAQSVDYSNNNVNQILQNKENKNSNEDDM